MTLGEQIRDFISVENVADKITNELTFKNSVKGVPNIKNIGSGNPQSVIEFAKYWWSFWNASGLLKPGALPYRDNEVMRFVPKID